MNDRLSLTIGRGLRYSNLIGRTVADASLSPFRFESWARLVFVSTFVRATFACRSKLVEFSLVDMSGPMGNGRNSASMKLCSIGFGERTDSEVWFYFSFQFLLKKSKENEFDRPRNLVRRDRILLNLVERNDVDRLNVVFELADLLFKKVGSDLKERILLSSVDREIKLANFVIFDDASDLQFLHSKSDRKEFGWKKEQGRCVSRRLVDCHIR